MTLVHDLINGLKDMIDGKRLTSEDIPDDFKWLETMLERLNNGRTPEDEVAIALARDTYCNDDVEIDPDCFLSHADQGTWVAGWLWVYHGDLDAKAESDVA